MNLSIARLQQFEFSEILARIRKKWWLRKIRPLAEQQLDGNGANFVPPLHHRKRVIMPSTESNTGFALFGETAPLFIAPEDRQACRKFYQANWPQEWERLLRQSDDYLHRRFSIFQQTAHFDRLADQAEASESGQGIEQIGHTINNQDIDWHREPVSGKRWPLKFYGDIVYTGEAGIGDVKYPWELSRHHHLVTLAQVYFLTQDETYAAAIVDHMTSWIRHNPPFLGVNWLSPLEIGIRIINWVWSLSLIRDSAALTPEFCRTILNSVAVQGDHVFHNLQIGYYANNHLIGEAAGLAIGGVFFSNLPRATKWHKTGLSILEKEIIKQIHPDGGGVEQAMSYLRFILDFFILSLISAQKNGNMFTPKALSRMEKAFDFIYGTLQPDGRAPNFGDSDDARAVFLAGGDYWDFRRFLAIGAVLFDRADFKIRGMAPPPEIFWLFGSDGIERYRKLDATGAEFTSRLFPGSGYAVLRNDGKLTKAAPAKHQGTYLFMDVGSLGYRTGAHGHADALSLQFWTCGVKFLVDPGTYAYNQDPLFRSYFRSTRAHNTIMVDGKDQADIKDRMSWASMPESRVHDRFFSNEIDLISAEHNGYKRLSSPVTHKRTVLFIKNPGYALIIDQITATDTHSLDLIFHFPPKARLNDGHGGVIITLDNRSLLLGVSASHEVTSEIKKGDPQPMGWYSNAYGHKTPSPSLTFSCKATGSVNFLTSLLPLPDEGSMPHEIIRESNLEFSHCRIRHALGEDILLFNHGTERFTYEEVSFHGKLVLLRRKINAAFHSAFIWEVTKLELQNQTVYDSKEPVTDFLFHIHEED